MTHTLAELQAGLPPQPSEAELLPRLQRAVAAGPRPLVAIDDDPTGVQTVHDTTVLLSWDEPELRWALEQPASVFFVLTNSRSLPAPDAERVALEVGRNLTRAQAQARQQPSHFVVTSRSDSTLRGHYPLEVLALQQALATPFDAHLLVPAFFEGGRYTIADTHWVATPEPTSATVIPASETSFAHDAVFGYRTAYLPAWVEEKSQGRWRADAVQSISLEVIRRGPTEVSARLQQLAGGVPVVVNAAGYGDLTAFVLGLLEAEAAGKRFLYRTAASFVRVRAGQAPRPLLGAADVYAAAGGQPASERPGLVVVGSYQPSSSRQLERLLAADDLRPQPIEVSVPEVLAGRSAPERLATEVDGALDQQRLPVLFTSRELVTGSGDENLAIGQRVTEALVAVVQHLHRQPRFVIAKGGITSHEVAQRGLGARRATALGQLQAGVPVWQLVSGPDLRGSGMPYIVFPGNVGGPDSLVDAARVLAAG